MIVWDILRKKQFHQNIRIVYEYFRDEINCLISAFGQKYFDNILKLVYVL